MVRGIPYGVKAITVSDYARFAGIGRLGRPAPSTTSWFPSPIDGGGKIGGSVSPPLFYLPTPAVGVGGERQRDGRGNQCNGKWQNDGYLAP